MKLLRKGLLKRPAGHLQYSQKSSKGVQKGGFKLKNILPAKSSLSVPRLGTYRVRANTNDAEVIKELTSYRLLFEDMEEFESARLLDLGGHIGCISVEAALRGIEVTAVEPFPANISAFQTHVLLNKVQNEITLIEGGVVASQYQEDTIQLYLNSGINMGNHQTEAVRGRKPITVAALSISDVLKEAKPSHVKMDIEGAEYDLLPSLWARRSLRTIFAELHYGTPALRSKMNATLKKKPKEWKVVKKPAITPLGRHTLVMWKRFFTFVLCSYILCYLCSYVLQFYL